jgi:hypothetical protein
MVETKWPKNLAAILVILNQTNIVESTIRKLDHLITGHKKRPKNDHSNTGQSGIRWFTVYIFSIEKKNLQNIFKLTT